MASVCGEGVAFWGYSTASASSAAPKWRIIIPTEEVWSYDDWHDASELIFQRLEQQGIVVDRAMSRAGQISFLPNVPPDRCDQKGRPLFHESFDHDGHGLPWKAIAGGVDELRANLRLEKQFAEASRAIGWEGAFANKAGDQGSVIAAFNATHPLATLLSTYGYLRSPANPVDWRSPMQTSESYATRIFTIPEGGEYFVSLSGSDAEAGLGAAGAKGGRYGDAFDLFVHFEHFGDFTAALKCAASDLQALPAGSVGHVPEEQTEPASPANRFCHPGAKGRLLIKVGRSISCSVV